MLNWSVFKIAVSVQSAKSNYVFLFQFIAYFISCQVNFPYVDNVASKMPVHPCSLILDLILSASNAGRGRFMVMLQVAHYEKMSALFKTDPDQRMPTR